MWDFSVREALALVLRTWPFLLVRAGVYLGIAAAHIAAVGAGAGLGLLVGTLFGAGGAAAGALVGGLCGMGLVAGALWWLRAYLLYLVKAGHVAALVLAMNHGVPPQGQGQIGHALAVVRQRFGEVNVLFALDILLRGVIGALVSLLDVAASLLPLPGKPALVGFADAVLRVALGFVDEIVLAWNIRANTRNPWETSRAALVLYAQNGGTLLKNAVWLAAISNGIAALVFLIALGPMAALAYGLPGGWGVLGIVLALVAAWAFRQAVVEPFVIAALMEVYFRTVAGQTPDPEWDARLAAHTSAFREIKDRAARFAGGAGRPRIDTAI